MSIRRYLLVSLLLTLIGIGTLATLAGYLGSRHEADELFDAQLAQYARTLAALLEEHDPRRNPLIARERGTGVGHDYEAKVAFEVWSEQGQRLAYTENFPQLALQRLSAGYHDVWWQERLWRLFVLHDPITRRWIITGERGDIRGELAAEIAWQAVLPMVIGWPLAALLIWWIVGSGLAPLRRLADEFHQREASDLAPIPLEALPAELEQLTLSANDLLRRLADAFERERRFAADAAHELRTPIAALLVHLENAIAEAAPAQQPSLRQTLQNAHRLRRVVEQLLALARSSPERFLARFEQVDLAALAREVAAELAPLAAARQQSLEIRVGRGCGIEGDRTLLAVLLRNLMDNAINYTPESGTLALWVERRDDQVELSVQDSGPGIPAAQRGRIFDRFYRGGGDRHASQVQGSGLGLAIVRQITELHRGRIELSEPEQPGLRVSVLFPAA